MLALGTIKVCVSESILPNFFIRKWTFNLYFAKLDCFIVTALFSYVTNTQARQQKSEKQRNQRLVRLAPDQSEIFQEVY